MVVLISTASIYTPPDARALAAALLAAAEVAERKVRACRAATGREG
jgi:hypothetical protein